LADRIEADYETAGVDERRLAILRFADKLTRTPGSMSSEDVESLRSVNCSDVDILHVTEVVAYYAYVNRLADALGVPLESWIPQDE
jgi:uncharacterized peroxidase-related enzyme